MTDRRNFQLSDDEVKVIERAMGHDKRPEVRQKAQALYLLHRGEKVVRVAEMMAVSRPTIYEWHNGWLANGVEGLARRKGSGRKRKASPEYERLLEETLETNPAELGYDFAVWTVERLAAHLYEQTGIELSYRTLNETLKRLKYVYRRPKLDLRYLHDPEVMASAEANLSELKKRPEAARSSSSLWTKRR